MQVSEAGGVDFEPGCSSFRKWDRILLRFVDREAGRGVKDGVDNGEDGTMGK
jgi:hypothetical protein